MSASTMVSIMDNIRASASLEYQNRVPLAVQTSINNVGNPILERTDIANEFLSQLIGRIGLTMIKQRIATNPLSTLKKGSMPLGSDIQDIFINMAQDQGFDGKGDKVFTKTPADVKVLYHRRNRQSQYPITVSREMLATAFTSYDKLEEMLTGIVNSMYSADNKDEFVLTKNTFASAISTDKIINVKVADIGATGGAKALVKDIIKTSKMFQFPSPAWNSYNKNKPASDSGRDIETWVPLENQILIIRADILTEIDVEEIASAYNMDKVTFKSKVVEVDNFGSATNCYAILCDESFVEIRDNLFEVTSQYNGQGLFLNYWLNHWQTYSLSLFANAVAFIENSESVSLSPATLTFANATPQVITPTKLPSDATLTWLTTNPDVATVVDGTVTPVGDGSCYIQAINGDAIANCKVTVDLP